MRKAAGSRTDASKSRACAGGTVSRADLLSDATTVHCDNALECAKPLAVGRTRQSHGLVPEELFPEPTSCRTRRPCIVTMRSNAQSRWQSDGRVKVTGLCRRNCFQSRHLVGRDDRAL